jgi:hypothetical protein
MTKDEALEYLLSNSRKYVDCQCLTGQLNTTSHTDSCPDCEGQGVVKNALYEEACQLVGIDPEYTAEAYVLAVSKRVMDKTFNNFIGSPFDLTTLQKIADGVAKHLTNSVKLTFKKP